MQDVTNTHTAVRKMLVDVHNTSGTTSSTGAGRLNLAIDMPASKVSRKDMITLAQDENSLMPAYYGMFERDLVWEMDEDRMPFGESSIYGDVEPDRQSRGEWSE
jgi:hypothetical protein